jgi:hypothetical protein
VICADKLSGKFSLASNFKNMQCKFELQLKLISVNINWFICYDEICYCQIFVYNYSILVKQIIVYVDNLLVEPL